LYYEVATSFIYRNPEGVDYVGDSIDSNHGDNRNSNDYNDQKHGTRSVIQFLCHYFVARELLVANTLRYCFIFIIIYDLM
jgi:hypothetical protein